MAIVVFVIVAFGSIALGITLGSAIAAAHTKVLASVRDEDNTPRGQRLLAWFGY